VLAMLLARTPEQAAHERPEPRYEVCIRVIKQRAEELGYAIELFNVGEVTNPALTPSRLQTILRTRAISGILLPPVGIHPPVLPSDLSLFSFAEGMDRGVPPFFSGVQSAVFPNALTAMREIHALGHRRVGVFQGGMLFVEENIAAYRHSAVKHGWSMLEPYQRVDYNTDALAAWLAHERPTVVYSNYYGLHTTLAELGLRIPEDIGFVLNEVPHHRLKVDPSGIDDKPDLMFSSMVDQLVEQLNRDERGVPAVRKRMEIVGEWHAGTTLGKAPPAARRSAGWHAFMRRHGDGH
jgi:DNA-binding LacI/PurR family transcriptional regulator